MGKVDESIFGFAFAMAMRDATLQRAFPAQDKRRLWQKDANESEEVTEAREKIKEELRKYVDSIYIDSIFNKTGKSMDFDEVEEQVEDAVKDFISAAGIKKATKEGEPPSEELAKFTFGNTQKLVNMTAKYMFMATYGRSNLRERFSLCHCPMDSVMVDEVIRQIGEKKPTEESLAKALRDKHECRDGKKSKWKVYLQQPWSGITENTRGQYDLFQDLVKYLCKELKLYPIEFDFKYW